MVPKAAPPVADTDESSIPSSMTTVERVDESTSSTDSDVPERRPANPRRSTDPASTTSGTSSTPSSNLSVNGTLPLPIRSRNRSPFSRSHLRSKSSTGSLSAPLMTRAHSSPVMDTTGRVFMSTNTGRPSSPLGPPGRRRSPLRRTFDEFSPAFGGQIDFWETISEHKELELTPRATTADSDPILSSPMPLHHTFPRNRRRPSSPLYSIAGQQTMFSNPGISASASSTSSPSLAPTTKFNEPYPSNVSFSSSSMPSTPTSLRSRSPSISSLETIPDSPDAEEAAIEADRIARLKAAADEEEARTRGGGEPGPRQRRGSVEAAAPSGMGRGGMFLGTNGFGNAFGVNGRGDKRKRWSVCGAERRGDLDLETIWED